MFQHVTPWKFNPQNQDYIYCASLFLPEHFQPHWSSSWPRHQNITRIAQICSVSFEQRTFLGIVRGGEGSSLSVLSTLFSPGLLLLLEGRDLLRSRWSLAKPCVLLPPPPQWAGNSSCTPACIHSPPSPQIPREWAEFGGAGLSQPLPVPLGAALLEESKEPVHFLQLGWRGCSALGCNNLEGDSRCLFCGKKKKKPTKKNPTEKNELQ